MSDGKRLEQNLCWEIGIVQQRKHGEVICGDNVTVRKHGDRVQIVLADGLGSGIQANIAATLTSTLVSELTEAGVSTEDSLHTVDQVLPLTRKHNLAYSTFTLVSAEGREIRLVQYDNPPAVFMRDGVSLAYPRETSELGDDRMISESRLTMKSGDMLILFSDGVSEAGRGVTTYSGWDRREMEDYLSRNIGPDDNARRVAAEVVSAVQALDLYEYHDDTTVVVLRLRERMTVDLLLGAEGTLPTEQGSGQLFPEQDRIRVACGRETVRETVSLLERFLQDGMMSLRMGEEQTEASKLLALLAEQASDVNLLLNSAAAGAGEENEITETAELLLNLRHLLEEAGKTVTLGIC